MNTKSETQAKIDNLLVEMDSSISMVDYLTNKVGCMSMMGYSADEIQKVMDTLRKEEQAYRAIQTNLAELQAEQAEYQDWLANAPMEPIASLSDFLTYFA